MGDFHAPDQNLQLLGKSSITASLIFSVCASHLMISFFPFMYSFWSTMCSCCSTVEVMCFFAGPKVHANSLWSSLGRQEWDSTPVLLNGTGWLNNRAAESWCHLHSLSLGELLLFPWHSHPTEVRLWCRSRSSFKCILTPASLLSCEVL